MTDAEAPALDSHQLQREIEGLLGGDAIDLLYLHSCESTNIECQKLGTHQSVVIAEQQTAGRGRRGNCWYSPLTQNIYCSIGVHKNLPPELLGLIPLQVGVCIASVLQESGFPEVTLKWPNDILLQGKKLGGILIETRALGDQAFFLVIGVGLNLHLDQETLDQIDQPAISLRQVAEHALDRQQLYKDLIARIAQSVNRFDADSIESLLQQFKQLDAYLGREVVVKTRDQQISGIYQGIAGDGQIQIQTADGLRHFAAAEISLRVNSDAVD
ncbi:MAG: biotin--[acetyl-CoA-carboxylase] ligase [Gammaproteobacteria bacterium]|nr:biotin--[acetyl-CoA-carboxylase] ligase [Gammaproteobacteria bacterium]